MNCSTPLHAKINVGESVPCMYFSPPSLPERPVLNVTAYFGGREFVLRGARMGKIGNYNKLLIDIRETTN
jgi:hypothetical protein